MPYTNDDGGRLNNFANEPKVYQAEPPTNKEKRNYTVLGIAAFLLVGIVIYIAFSVSHVN